MSLVVIRITAITFLLHPGLACTWQTWLGTGGDSWSARCTATPGPIPAEVLAVSRHEEVSQVPSMHIIRY